MTVLPLLLLQVSVRPTAIMPTLHQRLTVQVANPTDTPIVSVRVAVPAVVALLGVDAPLGWTARYAPGSDTAPPTIEWTGGPLGRLEYREFAFLGRLPADAKRETLVFPVRLGRADGSSLTWGPGGIGPAPEVQIEGTVAVTPGGAFALAAGALGLAALATALALRRRA